MFVVESFPRPTGCRAKTITILTIRFERVRAIRPTTVARPIRGSPANTSMTSEKNRREIEKYFKPIAPGGRRNDITPKNRYAVVFSSIRFRSSSETRGLVFHNTDGGYARVCSIVVVFPLKTNDPSKFWTNRRFAFMCSYAHARGAP